MPTFLFDLDGTLVDTNLAHVEAWRRAFERKGHHVTAELIRPQVGKGGDQLIPDILGPIPEPRQEELSKLHGEIFEQLSKEQTFAILPGALELLQELQKRGFERILATSSNPKDMASVQRGCDVDFPSLFDLTTGGHEAKQTKPHPDIIHVALDKAKRSPIECVMVGDTPYDIYASHAAKVRAVAVMSGRCHTREQLLSGRPEAIYADCADLLAHLDELLALLRFI
jgi:HAD superfamily hydrolase (TIGR01509 family)